MLDWLDAIPNLGVPGVPGVQPQKTATLSGTPAEVCGVPGVPEHLTRTPGTPAGTPEPSTKLLNCNEEHTEHQEHRKSQQPSADDAPKPPEPLSPMEALRICRLGLGSLDAEKPLHGLSIQRWDQLRVDSSWLLDLYAAQAFRDGWTVGELFGLWWWDDAGSMKLKDGWGGIADRLRGSRSLVMTGDTARWRMMNCHVADQLNRGAYPELRPLWDP
jgi:hypothetical protein